MVAVKLLEQNCLHDLPVSLLGFSELLQSVQVYSEACVTQERKSWSKGVES